MIPNCRAGVKWLAMGFLWCRWRVKCDGFESGKDLKSMPGFGIVCIRDKKNKKWIYRL